MPAQRARARPASANSVTESTLISTTQSDRAAANVGSGCARSAAHGNGTMQRHATIAGLVLTAACGGGGGNDDGLFGSASMSASATSPSGTGDDDGATDDGATGADDGTAGSADSAADESDDGIKLDVGSNADLGGMCEANCDSCTYVDLLFVIDNSASMGDYQNALAIAFPDFASTLDDTLPPGTNVHVGVTSTEMGYSSMGSTSINNGACTFIGDGNQPNSAFYITPDDTDTGRNGAQGRLYAPNGQDPYFEFTTGGADLAALEAWFSAAATIGEGGANIEMSAAPVGWVADPANSATNDGFIRDKGAVLVVFFMQDEPDQTPAMIDGQTGGQFVLDRIAAAKTECGGLECVIAGGFLNANACNADGNLPLDDFLAGVGESPVVQALPDENTAEDDPATAAAEMNELLSTTLAEVIAQTCDEIGPEG